MDKTCLNGVEGACVLVTDQCSDNTDNGLEGEVSVGVMLDVLPNNVNEDSDHPKKICHENPSLQAAHNRSASVLLQEHSDYSQRLLADETKSFLISDTKVHSNSVCSDSVDPQPSLIIQESGTTESLSLRCSLPDIIDCEGEDDIDCSIDDALDEG